MALITADLVIPTVGELFPLTRRWRKVKPCGTAAAYRRHYRRKEPIDKVCRRWHRDEMRKHRARPRVAFGHNTEPDIPRFGADEEV